MVCQLLEFFLEYVHTYCQNSQGPSAMIMPAFIFNSFANLIAILFKKQFCLGNFKIDYFMTLKNKFFLTGQAANWHLIKMGFKIFNFLIDNVLIDSENMGYFNYRKLINVFQQNLLFHMMNLCRNSLKFMLASDINLSQFLLVSNPMAKVVVSGSQDTNLISNESEGRQAFFSKNTIYSQRGSQSKGNQTRFRSTSAFARRWKRAA